MHKLKDKDGYIRIYIPDKQKYYFEHRLIMEKYLNRSLMSIEEIHHNNGKRNDNRIHNLTLFPNKSEHRSYHNLGARNPIYRKDILNKKVLQLYKKGWSFPKIAKYFQCSSSTAYYRFKKAKEKYGYLAMDRKN